MAVEFPKTNVTPAPPIPACKGETVQVPKISNIEDNSKQILGIGISGKPDTKWDQAKRAITGTIFGKHPVELERNSDGNVDGFHLCKDKK